MEDLPIFPKEYKYEVTKATKKQFSILKKLMNESSVDTIIKCLRCRTRGRRPFSDGLYWSFLQKEGGKTLDFSMEDSAIKEGFSHLRDGAEYNSLFASAQARAIAELAGGYEYQ